MSEPISLLPPENPTPYELCVSLAVAEWFTAPVHLLDTLYDPRACPPDRLPSLAGELGVPLWLDRWTLNEKRAFTARWPTLSRQRGRKPTYQALLQAVGAEFRKWVVPPALCAPRPSRTPAQRAAYKAQFPEIRVYAYAERARRKGLLVAGKTWGGRRKAPKASTAPERSAHRAVHVFQGVSTTVTINVASPSAAYAGGFYSFSLPEKGRKLAPGRPWGGRRRCALPSTAASRKFQYAPGDAKPDLLPASQTPFSLQPDEVAERHKPGRLLTPGRPWGGRRRCPMPSVATQYVYESVRIFDADVAVQVGPSKPGGWILGKTQLGTERFRIDVTVDATYRAPGRRFIPGKPLRGAPRAHDGTRIKEICAALRAASIGRDKVMLKTGIYRVINPTDNLLPGSGYLPGQIIRTL